MIYELKGKIKHLGEVLNGMSKSGQPWQKCEVVVESQDGEYKDTVALVAFNDRVDDVAKMEEGEEVDVKFSISAREYNGRYYNDLRIFSIKGNGWSNRNTAPAPKEDNPENDLPF